MAGSLSIHWVHIVWSTQDRKRLIRKSFRGELHRFIKDEGYENNILIDTVNSMEDHIHLLVRVKPSQSISEIVKWIKGASSFFINRNYYEEGYFKWQEGYGVFSISKEHINNVRKYIYDQEKHHTN